MIGLRTKREEKCPYPSSVDLRASLNLAIKSLPSNEINSPQMNEILRLLELLRTAILVKQDSQENKFNLETSRFTDYETKESPIFNPATVFLRMGNYEHPWYTHLNKPNPPTQEAVDKAQFKDKTYHWDRSSDNRPRNKRTTK